MGRQSRGRLGGRFSIHNVTYEQWYCYIESLDRYGLVVGHNKLAGCYDVKDVGLVKEAEVRKVTKEESMKLGRTADE